MIVVPCMCLHSYRDLLIYDAISLLVVEDWLAIQLELP